MVRILTGKSLKPLITQSQAKISFGRGLEIFGVCGGIWTSAATLAPVSALMFLGLLGTHLTISEKIRKFVFFGVQARNVLEIEVKEETGEKLELEIFTDVGKRRLVLVLDEAIPENSDRVLFKEMISLGALRFNEEDGAAEAHRILERLKTENFVILEETSEIVFPETGKNFRLQDITREKVKTMEKRMPLWMRWRMTGDSLVEKQASQQLFVGALTVGMAAVVSAKSPAESSEHLKD
jgi:hypothetical protein